MSKDNPNYDENYKKKLLENFKNFDPTSEDVLKRIAKFSEKYNFNSGDVLKKVEDDKMFSAFFVKDPTKQNFHENAFYDFLVSIEGVKNAIQLNKRGSKAIYILNQEVRLGSELKEFRKKETKSMDFVFQYKNLSTIFYVFHKYTKESGGSQDNQKNDVVNSITKARSDKGCNNDIKIIYVTDGEYYKNQKIYNELKETISTASKNMYWMASDEIPSFLEKIYLEEK